MYIFQPDRYLLGKQIAAHAGAVTGRTLDIGAGTLDRYGDLFTTSEYIRMDVAEGPGIDVVGTAYAIPFPDASFDSLVSTQVFEHLADPAAAVREMFRVLKVGGKALVTAPQACELHEEPHDYFRYTTFGLRSMFEKGGFVVLSLEPRGAYFSLIAQLQIRYLIDRFRLYERPLLGRVWGKWLGLYGRFMISRDRHTTAASEKHTIGWCLVIEKSA